MKKKFFAVALATTMTVSTAISAMAETKDVTIGQGFSANTGEEALSGDFDVTYTLTDKSVGTNNWDNFIVELYTKDSVGKNDKGEAQPVYIDVRADNFGWLANATDGATLSFGDGASDWTTWADAMRAGADCKVNVKRSGNTFSFTVEAAGSTFTSSVTAGDFQGQDVVLYLTGENCELTNVKFTNNAAGGSGDVKTDDTKTGDAKTDDTKTETKAGDTTATTAAAKADTKTTTPKTGDVAPVAALASLAVVACAGVVVSRKKVTE